MRCANEGVQIHGGYGFIKDYPAEKYYRDVKLCTIGEGTSEIQRLVIARQLLKGLTALGRGSVSGLTRYPARIASLYRWRAHGATQVHGAVIILLSKVTAPFCASALPSKFTPVVIVIEVSARCFP